MSNANNYSDSCLVVFSGGQDSTTCLYWAKNIFSDVTALTFNYNQRHVLEIESAKKIASFANVRHEIFYLGSIFGGSSPLINKDLPVKKSNLEQIDTNQIQDTFVPGRNMLFLSLAASYAFNHNINNIVIGVSCEDYGGYPDCRPEFINSMQKAIELALAKQIIIHTPLINLSKAATVKLALKYDNCIDALALSTTCYNGVNPPCQTCNACVLRAKGFSQANVLDPLLK